jgi:hypothetical protein
VLSGTVFNVLTTFGNIGVPLNYVSGELIDGKNVFANFTLAGLGFTPGQYFLTAPNDRITINIGQINVPEPATWAMIIAGFGAVGTALRRRPRGEASVRVA